MSDISDSGDVVAKRKRGRPRKVPAPQFTGGAQNAAPVVPARKRMESRPLFRKATIAELHGYTPKPGEVLQWADGRDPDHPNHVTNYLQISHVGDQAIGYCEVEPWETVHRRELPGLSGATREDHGKGVDTLVRHGGMILVRTTADNFQAWKEYDRLRRAESRQENTRRSSGATRVADTASGGHWSTSGALVRSHDPIALSKQDLVNEARRAAE